MQDHPRLMQYNKTLKEAIDILRWVHAHREKDAKKVQVCMIILITDQEITLLARWNRTIPGIYENRELLLSLMDEIKGIPPDTITEAPDPTAG